MRQELGINLLVYKEKLDQGTAQSTLLKAIKDQGISLAEVRREYIKEASEFQAIAKEASQNDMTLYYSVPEKIVEDKVPNKNLTTYLEEAKKMNIQNVKFNIGSLNEIDQAGAEELKDILSKYEMTYTIENDQTNENGTFACPKCGKIYYPLTNGMDRILLAEGEKLYECQTGRNPMDKDTVTGLIVENRQKKGLYGIKNVSQGVWRGFYPDGKLKDIPNGQGIPIWNGMSVRFELGEEWNLRLMQQVEERKEDEDEQTV